MFTTVRQTVFDRPIDMYLENRTGKDMKLFKTELQSGYLYNNPPELIKAGETGHFKGDQTGLVGSSGFATYTVQVENLTTYISIYWSHPEGNYDSIYYGYSSPFGVFFITPKDNLDPNKKPTNQVQNVKDWTNNEYSKQTILTLNPVQLVQSVTYVIQFGLGHTAV
ncbi:hypothetical protein [Hathewaya limosa]|uniref:Uncharacterized protein n=1 Tax=Hathewaya limosa TaxID=1536 RepID=A0ABU0JXR8_HATLI|nr:hypothetical protein [Hathewaya limosa]AWZ48926.1 hypothetical protein C3495_08920 [Clostridiaceae bacterium 14S0207]MDQ0480953.1 hypothetical protein [Hathewaya limosa]